MFAEELWGDHCQENASKSPAEANEPKLYQQLKMAIQLNLTQD
jgi:hypothetical protein